MMVNNPANAGLMPGPGISLAILSNSFSALLAVCFAMEWLVEAVSERDGMTFKVGIATEVATSDTASVAGRASDRVGFGVVVFDGECCSRLGFNIKGRDPGDLCLSSLNIEDNLGGMNFGMMIQNQEL
jgi:hypothetical protein